MDGGPMGGGKPAPPAVKLVQCDEQAILSVRSMEPFALIPLGLGVVFLALLVVGFVAPNPRPWLEVVEGRLLGVVIMLPIGLFFAVGGYFTFAPATLRIEIEPDTYTTCEGWQPLWKVKAGPTEDFERLSIHTYDRHGKHTTLFLHWRNPKKRPYAVHTSNRQETEGYGRAIADLLDVPFSPPEERQP